MTMHTIPGVGSRLEEDDVEGTPALSAVPLRPPRVENAAAFDNSNFQLDRIHQPADATRLLRKAIERSGQRTGTIAGTTGLNRATVNIAKRGNHNTTFVNLLRILAAVGARLYVAIPKEKHRQ